MVDADGYFEGPLAGAAERHVDVNDTRASILSAVVVADTTQHAFDDVDVMLSAIQEAHTICQCTGDAACAPEALKGTTEE